MPKLDWSDADEIGYRLHQDEPELDPLTVRFTDLRRRVLGLVDFGGDPAGGGEAALEAIQMAWLGYYRGGK